ncbi:DUF2076 domain-containing protein [Bradyrhizobium viridifuturi]|uniref:DUF2076 domain-containing protein n=1 Tax=Bradyrhizobium viridifuturi TaxID=1654716 RepID=UPI000AF3B404
MENAMTPQERQLIDDLFDRLAKLENAPRDSEAMSAIMQGLRNAPNAVYALVQTALVQDEALKRAHDRIQELEAAAGQQQPALQQGGFLDSMRDAIFGQGQGQPHGSVPPVRAPDMGAARSGTRARRCSRPAAMASPTASRRSNTDNRNSASPRLSAAARPAAGAARSSAPRLRPRPAWSAADCCSPASAA